jgi:hypothetical protein
MDPDSAEGGMAGHAMSMDLREASGTAWQPESSPMFGFHSMHGPWRVMTHYNVFLNYDRQTGKRGDSDLNSINWGMIMASRSMGKGDLTLRFMPSLEPLTLGGFGYPLLFQTGESWNDRPLVDRQHPHDLFMEIAAKYQLPLGGKSSAFLYAGLPGEPALGPVAFMHRVSALSNPAAPLSHHWQDSTHVTFGVVTAGVQNAKWKLEGSAFRGREPDENRYDIERPKLDSYSGRLTYNPNPFWSFSGSHGLIKSPEALHADEDVHRSVLSAMYNRPLEGGRNWATTAVWGRNHSNEHGATDSWLLESSLDLTGRDTLFGRIEHVQKPGEELQAGDPVTKYGVSAFTLGAERTLTPGREHQLSVGASVTVYGAPSGLRPVYGKNPTGWWVFLRLKPKGMRMFHGG